MDIKSLWQKLDQIAESTDHKSIPESKKKKPDADGDGVPDWADKKPGKDDKKKVEEGTGKQVDMKGKKCTSCNKGTYQETDIQDDMHGELHCTKCNTVIKSRQPAKSKKKGVSESYTPSAGELARDLRKMSDSDFSKKYSMSKKQAWVHYSSSNLKEQDVAEGRGFRGVGGAREREDDERHDLTRTDWYIVKDGKLLKALIYPRQESQARAEGFSPTREEARAKASKKGVAEGSGDKNQLKQEIKELEKLARLLSFEPSQTDPKTGNGYRPNYIKTVRKIEKLKAQLKSQKDVSEDAPELKNVKHFAKPGGYGRKIDKDDESGDAFHSSDIDDTDDAPAAKAPVKRGRGRPMKGGDSETGITKKYDTDTLSSWIIGNKPKNIGKIGKVSHVHRLKEYMEMVERKTIVEGYVAEGRMSELAMIVDDIIDGRLDIYDIISGKFTPTSDLEDFVQQTLIKSYEETARDHGLHADDDGDKIIGIMYNDIHDIMSKALNKGIDEQAMPGSAQPDMTTPTTPPAGQSAADATTQQQVPVRVNGQIVGMAPNQAAAQQAAQKMTQNSNNQKELAKLGVTQVQESLSDTMNRFSSILNESNGRRTVGRRTLSESKTPKLVMEGTLEEIIAVHPHEHKMYQDGWGLDEGLYEALCDHYYKEGRIPRKVWHGSSDDLRNCVEECYLQDTQPLMSEEVDEGSLSDVNWKDVGASTIGSVGGYMAGDATGIPFAGIAGAGIGGAIGSAFAKDDEVKEDDDHEVAAGLGGLALGGGLGYAAGSGALDGIVGSAMGLMGLEEDDMEEGFAGGALGGIAGAALTKSPKGAIAGAKFGSDIQDSFGKKSPFENEEMDIRRHAMNKLIDELDESTYETLKTDMSESKKPSAGMTKGEKSSLVKKAKSGKDIGKPGKGFDKLAKKAGEKYGSAEKGKKVAAAAMWKNAAHQKHESVEESQLNELSPKTLGSYVKKAHTQSSQNSHYIGMGNNDPETREKAIRSMKNRTKGIRKAVDRLTNEQQLDELSKGTLGSYVKKASKDVEGKAGEKQQYKDMFAGDYPVRGAKKEVAKKQEKINKRQSGIGKAVDKMTNEATDDDYDQAAILKGKRGRDARDNPSKAVAAAKRSPAAQDARAKLDKVRQSELKVKESAKPDFLDLDKDGNKKETMKKASSDKKRNSKSIAESYDFSEWDNQLSSLLKSTPKQAVSESAKIKKQMINESSNELSTMLQFAGLKNVQQVMEEFNASIYADDSESTSSTDGADNPPQLAMPTGMGMSQQKEDDDESTVVEPMMSDEVIGGLAKGDKESDKSDNDHLSFFKKMLSHGQSEVKTEKPKSESGEQSGIPASTSQSPVSGSSSEKPVTEDDMEEGNAFTGALAKAKSDGVQSGEKMKVGGKTYPVKEDTDVTSSGNGDNEEEQSEVSSDATRDAGLAQGDSNFFSSENSLTMAEDEHQGMSSDSIIGDILAKLTQLVGSEQGQPAMSAEPPVMVDVQYTDDEQPQDYADEESQDEEHCDQCQSCGETMYENHQCMESLNEWANSPTGESADEQFQTDMDFMTKVISGGLNNQKQDQTTLPSTRVVTRDESKDVSNTMGAMLRKLSGIN